MGWLNNLFTAAKGAVNDAGENMADATALTRLDQEIREADAQLRKARQDLTGVMADRKMADNKVAELEAQVKKYEGYVMQALDKGDEALATEVAQRIADIQAQYDDAKANRDQLSQTEQQLRNDVAKTEKQLQRMRNSVQSVKAMQSANKARAAVTARSSGAKSRLGDAVSSLERIKEQQQRERARLESAQELSNSASGTDLENKLKAAGIGGGAASANSVLARLKQERAAVSHSSNPALPSG